jgi:hypothetical protein
MDVEQETAKFKVMLVVAVVFLVSTFFAYLELKYSLGGKTAEAKVDRLSERRTRRGTTRVVHYQYRDENGQMRNGSDDVSRDWSAPASGIVAVQYLDDTSRLAGNRNTFALVIFVGSLLAMLVGGFLFWRHVREATRPTPRYKPPNRF